MSRLLRILAGAALATAITPAIAGDKTPSIVAFQDDNIDFHLRPCTTDPSGLCPVVGGGELETGDVLLAVLEFNTIDGQPIVGYELTGVSVIEATATAGGFSFAPYSAGFNAATGLGIPFGAAGQNAMLALWRDSTPDLDIDGGLIPGLGSFSCATRAQCIAQASDGELFEVDGFGRPTDYWQALTLTANSNTILNSPFTTIWGFFNAGLSVLDPAASGASQDGLLTGLASLGSPAVDVLLSGTINGGGLGTEVPAGELASLIADGYVATTDTDMEKAIPTPATLALLGVGLLGFRLVRGRRA